MPGTTLSGMLLFLILSSTAVFSQSTKAGNEIGTLLRNKSYFEARDLYDAKKGSLTPIEKLRLGALTDNVFNRPEASNKKIEELRKQYANKLPDSIKFRLLEVEQSNFIRLGDYKAAADCIEELVSTYPQMLSQDAIADYHNTHNMWQSLAGIPRQEITIREHTVLKLQRDVASLSNMKVSLDTTSINFIFDTGANISTVTESTARRMNMQLTDAGVEVNSITGLKVQSKIAVCPEFNLGSIVVRNAIFLVFPDSALAVPQLDYQINGIIGFPVIEGLKEVTITKSGEFIVPVVRGKVRESNMALDFLTPLIQLGDEVYTFDSGANSTMLYAPYYAKHRKAISRRYKEKEVSYGGAGGTISRPAFQITWNPEISGKQLSIEDVTVFRESSLNNEDFFYGNIGQDVIQQFESMTLNFESMFIRFE